MRKEKKKKEIEFDPADYDYMDNMPLAGWIWEFIRRNNSYQQHFSSQKKNSAYSFDCLGLFGLIPYRYYRRLPNDPPSQRKYLVNTRGLTDDTINDPALRAMTLYEYFPNPATRYCDFGKHKPLIKGLLNIKWHDMRSDLLKPKIDSTNAEYQKYCCTIITNYLAINDPQDTLYLGISKNAKIDDIKGEIDDALREYVKPKRNMPRSRTKKWKWYLIAYDLIANSKDALSDSDVADWLLKAYPGEPAGYFDTRNCNNFYKNAVLLINGGYKKYLITK